MTDIAGLIAEALATGLLHPGDPNTNQPPMPIILPVFRTAGMAPEMKEIADKTARLIGEAIVTLIETKGEAMIIPKAELAAWRDATAAVDSVTVHCHCDRTFTDPLLKIDNRVRVVVDGTRLLTALTRRDPACPHRMRS